MILHTVVNRTSRSGDIIGPNQRISPYIALKSITDWAAYQYFEEDKKGTIKEGKSIYQKKSNGVVSVLEVVYQN